MTIVARNRIIVAWFLTVFLLSGFLVMAMPEISRAEELEKYKFDSEAIGIQLFCYSPMPYTEIKEALAVGGPKLAKEVAVISARVGVCQIIPSRVSFYPKNVVKIFPPDDHDDIGYVVEGIIYHKERGKLTVYIWMTEEALQESLLGSKA